MEEMLSKHVLFPLLIIKIPLFFLMNKKNVIMFSKIYVENQAKTILLFYLK